MFENTNIRLNCDNCEKEYYRNPSLLAVYRDFGDDKNLCDDCFKSSISSLPAKERRKIRKKIEKAENDENYTSTCLYCHKPSKLAVLSEFPHFCSYKCYEKYHAQGVLKTSKCEVCKESFYHYGSAYTCSPECTVKGIKHLNLYQQLQNAPAGKRDENYFWALVQTALLTQSKIVNKVWGFEVHLVNNDYCAKFLVFWKGARLSTHVHKVKQEIFICLAGRLTCQLADHDFVLYPGNKVEIDPYTVHTVHAIENSILLEVSTKDYPEDSFRISPSIPPNNNEKTE